jgi:hypothetical protein
MLPQRSQELTPTAHRGLRLSSEIECYRGYLRHEENMTRRHSVTEKALIMRTAYLLRVRVLAALET